MNVNRTSTGATRAPFALTHRAIEALAPEASAYRVPDLRCPGLAIRVAPSGVRTWDCSFRIRGAGRVRRLSLGPFPAISLEHARRRAQELVHAAKSGRDLLADEERAKADLEARLSVGAMVEEYCARVVRGKLRTARQIEGRMNRALSSLFARPAADVQRRDLRKILDAVADRGAPREAEKQRQVVSRLFRWALSRDLVDVDPSAGLASYGAGAPRDRVLEAAEIKTLWQWLDELPADYAEALRVQLAIGARIGEVAGIHAAEVDQEKWLWTLPAARSKNNRPRVTPLVGVARKIVAERLSLFGRGPLFIAEKGKQLSSQSVASMLIARRPTCPVAHFTTHDMRRTVATRMVDLGIGLELVAAVLGHEAGGANVRTLTRHYIRTDLIDRKRVALEAWNARLIQIVEGGAVMENILPLTARGG